MGSRTETAYRTPTGMTGVRIKDGADRLKNRLN